MKVYVVTVKKCDRAGAYGEIDKIFNSEKAAKEYMDTLHISPTLKEYNLYNQEYVNKLYDNMFK